MKLDKLKIDKDVPVPAVKKTKEKKWAILESLEPGDSVLVPIRKNRIEKDKMRINQAAFRYIGKGNYRTAHDGDGVRIWKIR